MPTPTEVHASPRAAYRYAARHWVAVVLAVVAGAALVPFARALAPGSFIPHVQVQNPSEYGVEMAVSNASRDGWMPVGTTLPDRTTTFAEVYDQGDTWVVRFAYGPFERSMTVSRADLQRAGWQVTVPDELITQLRRAHVPETPVFGRE